MIFHYQRLEKLMLDLTEDLKRYLPKTDIENVLEMIEYNEFGCGFEIICVQLFEYDIKIPTVIYQKISTVGKMMEMPETSWNFLEELVKND